MVDHIAWTGGSGPRKLRDCSIEEIRYVCKLYTEQCETFRDFWTDIKNGGVIPNDVSQTFWTRARADAHASFRKI